MNLLVLTILLAFHAINGQLVDDCSGVTFTLHTRQYTQSFTDTSVDSINLIGSNIKILTNGDYQPLMTPLGYDSARDLKNGYLAVADLSIIIVGWPTGTDLSCQTSFTEAPKLANCIARVVMKIRTSKGIPLEHFHLIGSRSGAHVMGIVGKKINAIPNQTEQLGRISGLAPEGDCFQGADPSVILAPTDAKVVDVTHTTRNALGYNGLLGDADFMVNNGTASQPGCTNEVLPNMCSTQRATDLFVESMNSPCAYATKCDSSDLYYNGQCVNNPTIVYGAYMPSNTNGLYFMVTNSQSLYFICPQ